MNSEELELDAVRAEILKIFEDDITGINRAPRDENGNIVINISNHVRDYLKNLDSDFSTAVAKLFADARGGAMLRAARERVKAVITDKKQALGRLETTITQLIGSGRYVAAGDVLRQAEEENNTSKVDILKTGEALITATPNDSLFGILSHNHRPLPVEFTTPFLQLAENFPINRMVESPPDTGEPIAVVGKAGDRYIWLKMAEEVKKAQVFDFGVVHDERIKKESTRGAAMYVAGHLRLPFTCVIYWYTFIGDPDVYREMGVPEDIPPLRYATVVLDGSRLGMRSPSGRLLLVADFCEGGEGLTMPVEGNYRTVMYLTAAAVVDIAAPTEWHGRLCYQAATVGSEEKSLDRSTMGGLVDGMMSLTLMLSTKGIPLRREEPSPKLNAKRAKSKKPPLVAVTYVDTARYYQAAKNSESNTTHASPVPHLRRGHPRKLHDKDGKLLREIWVRDALVNCRSIDQIRPRDHYEVET